MNSFDREVGEIAAELRGLRKEMEGVNARLDKVDARLESHEETIEQRLISEAHIAGARKVLLWIGGASLTALMTVGGLVIGYIPEAVQWWLKSR